MAKLTELQIADHTMVVFTSDNGPDRGGFYFLNKMGHLRMGTLRGMHKRYYIIYYILCIDRDIDRDIT